MKETIKFHLARTAKGGGGDRYETTIEGEDRPTVIYVPQRLSRLGNAPPLAQIKVTFEEVQ